jgi:hypothetical protein
VKGSNIWYVRQDIHTYTISLLISVAAAPHMNKGDVPTSDTVCVCVCVCVCLGGAPLTPGCMGEGHTRTGNDRSWLPTTCGHHAWAHTRAYTNTMAILQSVCRGVCVCVCV